MAAFMTSRITGVMPKMSAGVHPHAVQGSPGTVIRLPELLRAPFSAAMSQSMLVPAFVALFGIVAALFVVGFAPSAIGREPMRTGADD
jgi:hypothetical protein